MWKNLIVKTKSNNKFKATNISSPVLSYYKNKEEWTKIPILELQLHPLDDLNEP